MALQPVSGVTPLRTNNIAFSGRKQRDDDYTAPTSSGFIPASVKAVPVIVLMAMSPLNNINANRPISDFPETNEIEMVSTTQAVKKPGIVGTQIFKPPSGEYTAYKFNRLDLDGNPKTFEAVEIIRYVPGQEGVVSKRGIVTSVFTQINDDRSKIMLRLNGVGLSTKNLNDYTPQSVYSELKTESYNQGNLEDILMYLTVLEMNNENNGAIKSISKPNDITSRTAMVKKLNAFLGQ